MKERLLREKNLTLDTCLQLCRAVELSKENIKTITGLTVEEVHAVQGAQYQRSANAVDCKFRRKDTRRTSRNVRRSGRSEQSVAERTILRLKMDEKCEYNCNRICD